MSIDSGKREQSRRRGIARVCEACQQAPVAYKIASDDPKQPYRVCGECRRRLQAYALRPLEWFRLAAIHGPGQFHLSEDFYSEQGEALSSEEEVEEPELWPAPRLGQVAGEMETLIDYALTRRMLALEDEVLAQLRRQDGKQLLRALRQRVAGVHSWEIEYQVYEICGPVLGREAEQWIRKRWQEYHPATFIALSAASASCLPLEEGFDRVVQVLASMPSREVRNACHALAAFRTEKALDWLEGHVSPPVTDTWGRLAAVSQLSWPRVEAWLERGHPLSLVALDALKICARPDTLLLQRLVPKLRAPASQEEMTARLLEYTAEDAAPRVRQSVAMIIEQWEKII